MIRASARKLREEHLQMKMTEVRKAELEERRMRFHTPETDIEVGYVTTFLDGSLALQTNASYQMNFAGQTGANSVSLLSRARIKF